MDDGKKKKQPKLKDINIFGRRNKDKNIK